MRAAVRRPAGITWPAEAEAAAPIVARRLRVLRVLHASRFCRCWLVHLHGLALRKMSVPPLFLCCVLIVLLVLDGVATSSDDCDRACTGLLCVAGASSCAPTSQHLQQPAPLLSPSNDDFDAAIVDLRVMTRTRFGDPTS